jgi:hypothetical protein
MCGKVIATIIALWATAANAEEVLLCVDTDATGFVWRNGQAKQALLKTERYTVKALSETERVITRMEGDTAGSALQYLCMPSPLEPRDAIACTDLPFHGEPWVFKGMAYTRAILAGGPIGYDPNIAVAYGMCTRASLRDQ